MKAVFIGRLLLRILLLIAIAELGMVIILNLVFFNFVNSFRVKNENDNEIAQLHAVFVLFRLKVNKRVTSNLISNQKKSYDKKL
uniref:Uncharacterized protein n=1 Tax=Onchocerca volvulus TaxID=6282 RepID=A0A8R1Y347_ONCVO